MCEWSVAMLKQGSNHKVKRNPGTMIRVVFCNESAGEVVKHYNKKTINDVPMMRGFHVKSWSVVPTVRYSK